LYSDQNLKQKDGINRKNLTNLVANILNGDWILARFSSKKPVANYEGKILEINESVDPWVCFLRTFFGTEINFTFPQNEDSSETPREDVVKILPKPGWPSRKVMFWLSFSGYNFR
jgi:hypothetical protein